jgi:hypothetical protein
MTKKPNLDEATLRIAQRMLSTPPKPHEKMKIGKRKAGRGENPSATIRKSQSRKRGVS